MKLNFYAAWKSKTAEQKIKIMYLLFAFLMFSIAVTCNLLFGHALLHQQAAARAIVKATPPPGPPVVVAPLKDDVIILPQEDRWLLVIVVGLISMVPIFLLVVQLIRALRQWRDTMGQRGDPMETLLQLSVHAVPYGILSLSMLFEYHRISEGRAEGAAALASIMILFILSELGLILFSEVREARHASRDLGEVLKKAERTQEELHNGLTALPWVNLHTQLTKDSAAAPVVPTITSLLERYDALLSTPTGIRQLLVNVLLGQYLAEERKDITGDQQDLSKLPAGLSLPGTNHSGKASIFATNVSFYAGFLRNSVNVLAKEIGGQVNPTKRPCIVAVTTALPSQLWNWPVDDSIALEYKPISDYRRAQFEAVAKNNLSVFRTILVARDQAVEGDQTQNVGTFSRLASNALRAQQEWSEQLELSFILIDRDDGPHPLTRENTQDDLPSGLARNLQWIEKEKGETNEKKKNVYWLVTETKNQAYKYEKLWSYYCRRMHPTSQSSSGSSKAPRSGRTEVFGIDRSAFSARWGQGFAGCSDLMFLGTSGIGNDDIWRNYKDVDWGLAIMTSMSSRTETMFMLVVHEAGLIKDLWDHVLQARRNSNISELTNSDEIG